MSASASPSTTLLPPSVRCGDFAHTPCYWTSKRSRAWSSKTNRMGYVAVCDDPDDIKRLGRRDIVIAWRGPVTCMEWVEDFQAALLVGGFGATPDSSVNV
ncbi:hypothetical protein EJ110_NYTH54380 [Nymphaea thermarum]|nr:hypothetical protein EJ110_NYTH54380 [Nymphaea thermarum]